MTVSSFIFICSSILALDHEFVDKELRNFYKLEKMDLDRQMEALANLIQLRPHELTMRKDACAQIQVKTL